MSDENLARAREWAEAVNRMDADWMVEHASPEVVWEPLRAGTEGAFHGHEGLRAFIKDTEESFESFEGSASEMRAIPDGALVVGTIRIKGRGSGIETEVPAAGIMTFRDGLLVRFKDYGDRQKAFEAAGLA
jgi:ketosteroid isomerase-like protein